MRLFSILSAIFIVIDQVVKRIVVVKIKDNPPLHLIKFGKNQIIDINYVENNGAVFGSFSSYRIFLIIAPLIFLIGILIFIIKSKNNSQILTSSLAMIFGGGIGNLIDRIFRGGRVVDYIELKFFDFAIFNLADSFVVIGEIMLFLLILFDTFNDKTKGKNGDKKDNGKL